MDRQYWQVVGPLCAGEREGDPGAGGVDLRFRALGRFLWRAGGGGPLPPARPPAPLSAARLGATCGFPPLHPGPTEGSLRWSLPVVRLEGSASFAWLAFGGMGRGRGRMELSQSRGPRSLGPKPEEGGGLGWVLRGVERGSATSSAPHLQTCPFPGPRSRTSAFDAPSIGRRRQSRPPLGPSSPSPIPL